MQNLHPKILLLNALDKSEGVKLEFLNIMKKEIHNALEVSAPMTDAYHVKLSPTSSYFDMTFDDLNFDIATNKLLCVKAYDFTVPPIDAKSIYPLSRYRGKRVSVSFQKIYTDFSSTDTDLTFLFQSPKLLEKIQKYKAKNLPDMIKTYMML